MACASPQPRAAAARRVDGRGQVQVDPPLGLRLAHDGSPDGRAERDPALRGRLGAAALLLVAGLGGQQQHLLTVHEHLRAGHDVHVDAQRHAAQRRRDRRAGRAASRGSCRRTTRARPSRRRRLPRPSPPPSGRASCATGSRTGPPARPRTPPRWARRPGTPSRRRPSRRHPGRRSGHGWASGPLRAARRCRAPVRGGRWRARCPCRRRAG